MKAKINIAFLCIFAFVAYFQLIEAESGDDLQFLRNDICSYCKLMLPESKAPNSADAIPLTVDEATASLRKAIQNDERADNSLKMKQMTAYAARILTTKGCAENEDLKYVHKICGNRWLVELLLEEQNDKIFLPHPAFNSHHEAITAEMSASAEMAPPPSDFTYPPPATYDPQTSPSDVQSNPQHSSTPGHVDAPAPREVFHTPAPLDTPAAPMQVQQSHDQSTTSVHDPTLPHHSSTTGQVAASAPREEVYTQVPVETRKPSIQVQELYEHDQPTPFAHDPSSPHHSSTPGHNRAPPEEVYTQLPLETAKPSMQVQELHEHDQSTPFAHDPSLLHHFSIPEHNAAAAPLTEMYYTPVPVQNTIPTMQVQQPHDQSLQSAHSQPSSPHPFDLYHEQYKEHMQFAPSFTPSGGTSFDPHSVSQFQPQSPPELISMQPSAHYPDTQAHYYAMTSQEQPQSPSPTDFSHHHGNMFAGAP